MEVARSKAYRVTGRAAFMAEGFDVTKQPGAGGDLLARIHGRDAPLRTLH
jgi:hypothetical protein